MCASFSFSSILAFHAALATVSCASLLHLFVFICLMLLCLMPSLTTMWLVTSLSSLSCTFQTLAYSHFLQLPLATSNSMTVYSVHIVCTFVSRPLTQTLTLILTCLAPLSLNCSTTMCSVFPFVLYLCLILFLSTCLVPLSCSSKNWLLLIHMRHIVSCTFDSYDFLFILHLWLAPPLSCTFKSYFLLYCLELLPCTSVLHSCLVPLMLITDAFVCLAHLSVSFFFLRPFLPYSVQSWYNDFKMLTQYSVWPLCTTYWCSL